MQNGAKCVKLCLFLLACLVFFNQIEQDLDELTRISV